MPTLNDARHLINQFSEDELHALHHLIAERLRELARRRVSNALGHFQVLDKVCFDYHGQTKIGVIMRLNQKTASVLLQTGEQWNVSPHLLRKVVEGGGAAEQATMMAQDRR